jgi:transposase-like protein
VELLLHSGRSLEQIAAELGITTWTLRDWKTRFGPPPSTALSNDELQAENQRLRQELLRIKTPEHLKKRWASSRYRTTVGVKRCVPVDVQTDIVPA